MVFTPSSHFMADMDLITIWTSVGLKIAHVDGCIIAPNISNALLGSLYIGINGLARFGALGC